MNINWAAPKIDILNLDYPPIINVFRQPSEPFSLDSSHAQSCHVIIISNIKIRSLGLMIKHEQFNLNHSAKHIFSQKYILRTLFWE